MAFDPQALSSFLLEFLMSILNYEDPYIVVE